jgi:hypothetical protein
MSLTINWVLSLEPLTLNNLLIVLISSTVLGTVLARSYHLSHKKKGYDASFLFSLLVMPLVVSIIVLLVSNNLARAFSLAGVFTLVRFRVAMTDSSDVTYILASVGIGLSIALGYMLVGIIVTLFLSLILTLLSLLILDRKQHYAKLVVTMPEHLNIRNVLTDTLKKHVEHYSLDRIKTSDFGTLYKLSYRLKMKPNTDHKQLLDDIRYINGNLDVSLFEDYHMSYEDKI